MSIPAGPTSVAFLSTELIVLYGVVLSRQDVYQLDAAAVAAQEIVDKIADDEVRAAGAAVDDAAGEDRGGAVPLDVHRTAAMAFQASHLGPARRAAGFLFLDNLETVFRQA